VTRFLHTGDWQLGMTRHFFSEGVQERFAQSRFDAIRELGRIAEEENCQFMVVCGDVFESYQVDRKTVSRALEALKEELIGDRSFFTSSFSELCHRSSPKKC